MSAVLASGDKHKKAIENFGKRFSQLKNNRYSYETVWQDILDNCAPDLTGYISVKDLANAGDRADTAIYDSTPCKALQECAAGLYSATTPRSRRWFGLQMDEMSMDEGTQVRTWLDDVSDLMYKIMSASNYYDAKYLMKLHLAAVGTAVCIYYPDYENVIRAEVLNIGSYWLGSNARGEVDSLYREFEMTAGQLVDTFGDKVPLQIRNSLEHTKNTEAPHKVTHVIEPNKYNLGASPKKWVSAYYLSSGHEHKFLKISGFNFKPFVAPRWFRNQGEVYGKMCPGRNTLPDMKQLQSMAYDWNEAVAKVNRPPMQGKAELLENGILDLTPGAYNELGSMASADNFLKPLFAINPELKSLFESIKIKQEEVKNGFFIDKFQIVSMRIDKTMTATEINRLAGEALQALSPVSESMNSEELDPDIDIIFNYAFEAGIIPEPPEGLEGRTFDPNYISSLAQAQKMADANRIDEIVQTAIAWATNSQDMSILDNVDFDKALAIRNKSVGAPTGVLRDKEIVEQMRAIRQQQQQMMQMGAMMEQGANIAKTAGETPTGGDNLMGKMMEGMQGG